MEAVNVLGYCLLYAITREIRTTVKEFVNNQNRWKKVENCIEYTLEKQGRNEQQINKRLNKLIQSYQNGQKAPQYAYIQVNPNKATNLTQQNINILRQSLYQIPKTKHLPPYFSKVCGQPFLYRLNTNNRITFNINECDIYQTALNKKTNNFFMDHHQQRSYFDEQYTLKIVKKLAFFGILKYNLDSKLLQFQPNLLRCQSTRNRVFEKLEETFELERHAMILHLILCCIAFGVVFAFTSESLLNLLKRQKKFLFSLFKSNNQSLDKNIKTIPSQRLKCSCGKSMDLLPPCHHLTCCRQCYQLNKRCKICGAVSSQGQVIYI